MVGASSRTLRTSDVGSPMRGWRSAQATSSRCEWADNRDGSRHQAAAGAARLVVRARQMATNSAPRPKTTAANQTRPPRMGIRARTRRMPSRPGRQGPRRSAHRESAGQRSRPWHRARRIDQPQRRQQAETERNPDQRDQGDDGQDGEAEEHQQPPADGRADAGRHGLGIQAAPRPASHTRTSPTTRVETETASHQANRPAQPNPSQLVVCTRLVVPPIVAPEATTGACWETTSPVTLAPLRSITRPLNTTTSPLTRPEMVTGASKAVRDPSTVPSRSPSQGRRPGRRPAGPRAHPHGPTGPQARWSRKPALRRRRQPQRQDREQSDSHRPAHADHLQGFKPVLGQCSQLNTNRHDKPDRASAHP